MRVSSLFSVGFEVAREVGNGANNAIENLIEMKGNVLCQESQDEESLLLE